MYTLLSYTLPPFMEPSTLFQGRFRLNLPLRRSELGDLWLASDTAEGEAQVLLETVGPQAGLSPITQGQFRRFAQKRLHIGHPHLRSPLKYAIDTPHPWITYPAEQGRPLSGLIHEGTKPKEEEVWGMLRQVGSALAHLQRYGMVHWNVGPETVWVDVEGRYVLASLGLPPSLERALARDLDRDLSRPTTYVAPERLRFPHLGTPETDMFALGVLAYTYATGKTPWIGEGGEALRREDLLPDPGESFSKPFRALIKALTHPNPAQRPKASAVAEATTWPPPPPPVREPEPVPVAPSPEPEPKPAPPRKKRPSRAFFFLALIVIGAGALGAYGYIAPGRFVVEANGVTISCPTAEPGQKGMIGRERYVAVDRPLLQRMIAEGADLSRTCTSLVTDMAGLFKGKTTFNQSLAHWDVSQVTTMREMFAGATAFNQPLQDWDVSRVQDFGAMFERASSFNQPLGRWDVRNASQMDRMFSHATAFNQPLGLWDVGRVENMQLMFAFATSFNGWVGDWDVRNLRGSNAVMNMFYNATAFNKDLSWWCVEEIAAGPLPSFAMGSSLQEQHLPRWGSCPEKAIALTP